jgi:sulfopyruvate decarboxylase subunit beta
MMESFEAVKVISEHRGEALIVATMTPGTELPVVTTKPEWDLSWHWSAMGKASSVALGIALARPDRKVLVLDADGALLMNLGSLVSIANMAPPNFVHFLFDNGVYRCTGGQPLPRRGQISFAAFARDAGYPNVSEFADVETLESNIDRVISQAGPSFVCLKVAPSLEKPAFPYLPARDVVGRFREALQHS